MPNVKSKKIKQNNNNKKVRMRTRKMKKKGKNVMITGNKKYIRFSKKKKKV